jgi:TonB family protein
MAAVRRCYEVQLQRDPDASGRVAVGFTIGPSGRVTQAEVKGAVSSELRDCLVGVMKRWVFPVPEGGGEVKVSYPFVFQSH